MNLKNTFLSLLGGFSHLLSGHFSCSLLGVLNSGFSKNNPAVTSSENFWGGNNEEKGFVLSEDNSVDSFNLLEAKFLRHQMMRVAEDFALPGGLS